MRHIDWFLLAELTIAEAISQVLEQLHGRRKATTRRRSTGAHSPQTLEQRLLMTGSVPGSGVNLALTGTAYRWSGLTAADSNSNRALATGLNDGNQGADVPLNGGPDDFFNAFQAAGVIWGSSQSIAEVNFTNGSFDAVNYDGVFDANLQVQTTQDGLTWQAVGGWSLSPVYPYNLATAAGVTYTFSGPAVAAMGVRITGQVHTSNVGDNSWSANVTEVQAFQAASTALAPPTGLFYQSLSSSSITLGWQASTGSVDRYAIYRNGALVGTSTSTSFTDTNLTANTQYSYTIRAVDAAQQESAASAIFEPYTLGLTGATAALVGTGNTDNATQQLVRTSGNILYVVAPSGSSYPNSPGAVLKVWRATSAGTPTGYTLQDGANSPGGTVNTSSIAIDGNDVIHIIWHDGTGNVSYAQFNTITNLWGPVTVLENGGNASIQQGEQGVNIAVDANGRVHAVWQFIEAGVFHLHYANTIGGSWSLPMAIDVGTTVGAWHPAVGFAPNGDFLVAWLDGNYNYSPGTVKTRLRTAAGIWQATLTIPDTATVGIDNGPSLIIGADGTQSITFADAQNVIRYWYNNGSGWQGDQQPTLQVTHNPGLLPDGNGGFYIIGHATPVDGFRNQGYGKFFFRRNPDSTDWGNYQPFLNGLIDDASSSRWAQFFHYFPRTVDFTYWTTSTPVGDQDYTIHTATIVAAAPPVVRVSSGGAVISNGGNSSLGSVVLGRPVPVRSFEIQNTGTGDLVLQTAAVTANSGFTIVNNFTAGQVIAPGDSAVLKIALTATTPGTRNATLSFRTNDPSVGSYSISLAANINVPPAVTVIDDGDPGFSVTGNWAALTSGFGNDRRLASAGAGTAVANWNFVDLLAGEYRISATWPIPAANRANDALFTARAAPAAATLLSTSVNQRVNPVGITENGAVWQSLGNVTISGSTLLVSLANTLSGLVTADAVRIERVSTANPQPLLGNVQDDGDAGFALGGTWLTENSGFGGDRRVAAAGAGNATATWTYSNLTPGRYRIATTWNDPVATRANNAAYTVSLVPGGPILLTTQLNQRLSPATFSEGSTLWQTLGEVTIFGNALVVQLANTPVGAVAADAVRIERIGEPVTIVDDGDVGFTVNDSSLWASLASGFGNDRLLANAGAGSATASYQFSNLAPGQYRIASTWIEGTNRANNVPYVVSNTAGGRVLATLIGKQQVAPSGFTEGGVLFQTLGVVNSYGNSLIVRVSNTTGGSVNADAVRLERIGNPVTILDDGDTGFAVSGSFATLTTGYGNDRQFANPGNATAIATWTFTGLAAGTYRISTTWNTGSSRANDLLYTARETAGGATIGSFAANQRVAPAGPIMEGGVTFQTLGNVTIVGGQLVIRLANTLSGSVIADAIRIEHVA